MPETHHSLIPRPLPQLLSIVIPAYNEVEMVKPLCAKLTPFLNSLPCEVELIIVNDGSADQTLRELLNWAEVDHRVKILGLARNFGHQAAVTAGLDAATGEAAVIMDADLQDPPEIILDMLREYTRGYDVVYGQRNARIGENLFKRLSAWAFYRFMRTFIHPNLPADTGDFRLLSRRCLDALRSMRETHRFLRGMVTWVGFAQTAVRFDRPPRVAGTSKYNLRQMIRFAWTAAVSFSPAPLRLILFAGIVFSLFGMIDGVYCLARFSTGRHPLQGTTSVIATLCLIGGGILMSIGILGEYIGRIFEEVKGRPLYIISSKSNFEPPKPTPAATPIYRTVSGNSPANSRPAFTSNILDDSVTSPQK